MDNFKEQAKAKYLLLNNIIGVSTDELNSTINEGLSALDLSTTKYRHLKQKPYDKGWYNVLSHKQFGGASITPHEFEILNEILDNFIKSEYPSYYDEENNITTTTDFEKNKSSISDANEFGLFKKLIGNKKAILTRINYGLYINQDSLIPKIFEATYKQGLPNLKFQTLPHWNRAPFAFTEDNINVTLVDFATALAIRSKIDEPIFFWPFFYFNGWFIIIKKNSLLNYCKRKGISAKSFRELSKKEKADFILQSNIVVETKTDFEWVLQEFCGNFGAEISEAKIIENNTNEGKNKFVSEKDYNMYCTNPLNAIDLVNDSKNYESILTGVDHKNINGLLCTEAFYDKNNDAIQRLIKNWFYDIQNFTTEIEQLSKGERFWEHDYTPSFTIQNLVRELNTSLHLNKKNEIQLNDLPILYKHNNHFFNSAQDAYNSFYGNMLDNNLLLNNYLKITKLKLDKTITDEEIKILVQESKMIMAKIIKIKK